MPSLLFEVFLPQESLFKDFPQLKAMFEQAPSHPSGKKAREAELINGLFEKSGRGWVAKPNKPLFTESHRSVARDFSKDQQQSKPRAVWAEEFRDGQRCLVFTRNNVSALNNVFVSLRCFHTS